MYRKQYANSETSLLAPKTDILIIRADTDEYRRYSQPTLETDDSSFNEHQRLYTDNNNSNNFDKSENLQGELEIERSPSGGVVDGRTDLHFHTYSKKDGSTLDKRLNSLSLDDSTKSVSDPNISIQEGTSFQKRDSLYQTTLRKTKRFSQQHHLPRTPNIIKRTASRIPPRKSVTDTDEAGYDVEKHIFRRSSSLSSIPPYFYPDPYSIVVSRYLEDLGSLSPYSSAGSTATEYLQLSQAPSLLSTPETASNSLDIAERKQSESNILGIHNQTTEIQVLDDNMNFDSALSTSEEYQSFRSSVPLKKICVENDGSKEWKVYDAGPRSVRTPLLCLGPASATSDVFYRQILNLTARGMRVISVEGPVYWTVDDWCKGLKKLLDCLNLDKVHIFGASLGGFLAQKFAEYTYHYPRVASLILCNTFLDTSIFDYHDTAMIFWMLPSVILKKLIVQNITTARIMDLDIAHAIEFMLERLNNISQQELASRMTLNCVNNHVDTFKLKQIKMTIMDVFDDSALSSQAREDLYSHYTDAKLAHLKSGGNFPYLSRSDDVNMHLMVHLRSFNGTKHSAQLEESGMRKSSDTVTISRSIRAQTNGSSLSSKSAEDVLGARMVPCSLKDDNKEIKEQAASMLGLPVQ